MARENTLTSLIAGLNHEETQLFLDICLSLRSARFKLFKIKKELHRAKHPDIRSIELTEKIIEDSLGSLKNNPLFSNKVGDND